MFVDASAIVAILTGEAEADALTDRLDGRHGCITSPIAVFEATLAICRKREVSVAEARKDVGDFLDITGTGLVAAADGDTALAAFARYGKGRGHPAQLNLRDCFAYAMAKNHGVPLLFKGDDFDRTDIADGR